MSHLIGFSLCVMSGYAAISLFVSIYVDIHVRGTVERVWVKAFLLSLAFTVWLSTMCNWVLMPWYELAREFVRILAIAAGGDPGGGPRA